MPSRRVMRTGLMQEKLFFQPAAIAFDESAGLGLRAAARNRHARRAVRPQPQQIPPGADIADDQQRQHLRADLQRFQRHRSFRPLEPAYEIQPHADS